jgi:hypothetical protein
MDVSSARAREGWQHGLHGGHHLKGVCPRAGGLASRIAINAEIRDGLEMPGLTLLFRICWKLTPTILSVSNSIMPKKTAHVCKSRKNPEPFMVFPRQ